MLAPAQQRVKRGFDLLLSLVLLPLLGLPLLLIFVLLSLSLGRWAWFTQTRIGQYGRPFKIYKLRTLKGRSHALGTEAEDTHAFGRWLRRSHIDEWPQLLNILKGEMSFVGPRPDVPGFADQLQRDDRLILELKPGLTGPASLKYHQEALLLQKQANPEAYYREHIWPDKVQINKNYLQSYRFSLDLQLLFKTLLYAFK